MFIVIISLRFSGKSTVEDYLIAKGFRFVQFCDNDVEAGLAEHLFPEFARPRILMGPSDHSKR
jgi:hypothetical protein